MLIRVRKAGICGTDLHIASWDAWAERTIRPPLVVGHEFVGEIVEVGSNVSDFHAGDIVSGEGHVVCGRCRHCLAGHRHLCAHSVGLGVGRDGAFAEFVALPMTNVWHHWPGIDEDVAAIFDPFGNAVHTALRFEVLGEDVLVTGAGPIGLMAVAVVRHAGARHIVVSEPNAYRRALAERMGATAVVDPDDRGAGRRAAPAGHGGGLRRGPGDVRQCGRHPHRHRQHGPRGSPGTAGYPQRAHQPGPHDVIFKMLTISGIYGRQMYETWYKMSVMLQSGLDIRPAITHRFPFREHEAAFATARSGESGKVIMDWSL